MGEPNQERRALNQYNWVKPKDCKDMQRRRHRDCSCLRRAKRIERDMPLVDDAIRPHHIFRKPRQIQNITGRLTASLRIKTRREQYLWLRIRQAESSSN